jgi:succinoglycan biosynthesis protein ExoL
VRFDLGEASVSTVENAPTEVIGGERVPAGTRVVYLGPDITDAATFRRCEAFHRLGARLTSFTFERAGRTIERPGTWSHVDLGPMPYGLGRDRLRSLARAARTLNRCRETIAAVEVVWARNLDLGLLARPWLGRGAKLVYEVLDIHPVLLRRDLAGRLARALERRLLARADMVVVSSPAFARDYFRVLTPYRGPVRLLENKIGAPLELFDDATLEQARQRPPDPQVLRIGVVGRLRCERSLELVAHALAHCRRPLEVHVFGYPEAHVAARFEALAATEPRLVWHGRFTYPEGLPEVYSRMDLNWCIAVEPHQPENARWLLPNRIYEGGLFAVPALALAGTETGRWVAELEGGWLVEADDPAAVVRTLDRLDPTAVAAMRRHLARQPHTRFIDGYADHARLLAELIDAPAD